MRKRTSLAAASGAFAITVALSVATAGLAAASPVPAPAAPMQPPRPAPAITPHAPTASNAAAHPAVAPVRNKPAVPAARASSGKVTPSGGVRPLLTPPTTGTTCSGADSVTPPGGCDTVTQFTVTAGVLSITVPTGTTGAPVLLGAQHAGDIVASGLGTGAVGNVTVTDDRASLAASWNATVNSSAFVNQTPSTTAPDIPATDVYYYSGPVVGTPIGVGTPAGPGGIPAAVPIVITPGQSGTGATGAPTSGITTGTTPPGAINGAVPLGGTAPYCMQLSAGVGANQVVWHPTIAVDIPTTAVSGDYQGTITHSVS